MPRPLPTRSDIRAAARGTSARLERRAAFALLAASNDPEREALLAQVVQDARASPHPRAAAAITLGHIRTPEAERLLLQALDAAPADVHPDILRALGRIGTATALPTIDRHLTASSEAVAAAAQFAGGLIAHRLRLSEHDLPVPNADDLLEAPSTAQRLIEVADASESSSEDVLASLAHEGYGIDLAEHPLTQLTCGTDTHTVCVNREFTTSEALATLFEKKALLALVALASREGPGHSVSYIVLSAPSRSAATADLLAPRCSGRPALAGTARLSGDVLHFTLRAIKKPGARPLTITGTIDRGRLSVDQAVVGTRRLPAQQPMLVTDN